MLDNDDISSYNEGLIEAACVSMFPVCAVVKGLKRMKCMLGVKLKSE